MFWGLKIPYLNIWCCIFFLYKIIKNKQYTKPGLNLCCKFWSNVKLRWFYLFKYGATNLKQIENQVLGIKRKRNECSGDFFFATSKLSSLQSECLGKKQHAPDTCAGRISATFPARCLANETSAVLKQGWKPELTQLHRSTPNLVPWALHSLVQ